MSKKKVIICASLVVIAILLSFFFWKSFVKSGQKYSGAMTIDFYFGSREGVYTGALNNDGLPSGYGIFESENPNGITWTYTGEWVDGHFSGSGNTKWSDGSEYTGQYSMDEANGSGEYIFPDGYRYAGNFVSGIIYGDGILVYPDGSYFDGQFSDFETATGVYHDLTSLEYSATVTGGDLILNTEAPDDPLLEEDVTSENSSANTDLSLDDVAALLRVMYSSPANGSGAEVSVLSDGIQVDYWQDGIPQAFMNYRLGLNDDGKENEFVEACRSLSESGRETMDNFGYADKHFTFNVTGIDNPEMVYLTVVDGDVAYCVLGR